MLGELGQWVFSLLMAVLLALFLTVFVFQIIGVDGVSMADTLQDNERMFVTKFDYLLGNPQRFDVVVCHYPDRGNINFVKRIVGIPGDTVAVHGGLLYVNGEAIQEDYITYLPYYEMTDTLVEEGHYFVLGDNRTRSNDSHSPEVGQLARSQIKGKVRAVIWPLSAMRWIH